LSPADRSANIAAASTPDPPAVFQQPWQAQVFAITLALQARGLFSSTEWSEALGQEIRRAQAAGDPDTGETYYQHWLAALEGLVVAKGLVAVRTLAFYRQAWKEAAERTPHGTPIRLTDAELAGDAGDGRK
jgi:nitrile hydratase accessory protein